MRPRQRPLYHFELCAREAPLSVVEALERRSAVERVHALASLVLAAEAVAEDVVERPLFLAGERQPFDDG